jgi:hypothetical protein
MIHSVKQNLFFWLTVAFLHMVIAAPAFGQMQGSTIYSDAWGDDNYVYGSGVTDSPYNSYNHTFRAVTTMQSPNGRVSSYDTGYGSYASAFVSLSFDENDLGLYTIDTDHYDYCPIVLSEIFVGHSGAAAKTGRVILCYDFYRYDAATNLCYFQIQSNCPVTRCKTGNSSHSRLKAADLNCPPKVAVKFKWVEQETSSGCYCILTCYKTSDAPLYDDPTCFCSDTM